MAEKTQGGTTGLQRAGAESGMGSAVATLARLRQRVAAMPSSKRNWLVASVAFLLAATSAMVWYGNRPDWRVLFSGLEPKDVQQVSQELAAAAIPFQLSPDGSGVQVAADQLDKARMDVAAKGMPQTGRLGFELFDKPKCVGSEFDEKVNYQRALEGELERTIGTLAQVRSARVHLVLPQQSLFAAEERPAKASVVLQLRRSGIRLEAADSIRNLVAGAVENLSPEQAAELEGLKRKFPQLAKLAEHREALRRIFEDGRLRRPQTAVRRLKAWAERGEAMGLEALRKFNRTLSNWMGRIANYFVSRSTNGPTEGFNRGLRSILWRACGMASFAHFRLRVLHAFG